MPLSFHLSLGISVLSLSALSACAHQPVPAAIAPVAVTPAGAANLWRVGPLTELNVPPDRTHDGSLIDAIKSTRISATVYFSSNVAALSIAARRRLDRLVKQLNAPKTLSARRLQITGFTEGEATLAQNRRLALKRARAVRDYLVEAGIAAEQIHAKVSIARALLDPADVETSACAPSACALQPAA